MKPDVRTARKYRDLEKPSVPIYGASLGPGGTVTDSITPDMLRPDAMFAWGFDGGVVGITDWSFDTWIPKSIDGGTV